MLENDNRENTSIVKAKMSIEELFQYPVISHMMLVKVTKASKRTIRKWRDAGLKPLRSHTKSRMYLRKSILKVWSQIPPQLE